MTPVRLAAVLALGYLGLAGAYIVLSGELVAGMARSAAELAALERFKGIGFVVVTGTMLFFGAWWATRRARRDELEMARARELLLAAERQAMAGLFVSSLAHDANNMASIVLGTLDYVMIKPGVDPELKGLAQGAREATPHWGEVSASRSTLLGGACFQVRLPRAPPGVTSRPGPTAT